MAAADVMSAFDALFDPPTKQAFVQVNPGDPTGGQAPAVGGPPQGAAPAPPPGGDSAAAVGPAPGGPSPGAGVAPVDPAAAGAAPPDAAGQAPPPDAGGGQDPMAVLQQMIRQEVQQAVAPLVQQAGGGQDPNAAGPGGGAAGGAKKPGGKGGMDPEMVRNMSTDVYQMKTLIHHLFDQLGLTKPEMHDPNRDPATGHPVSAQGGSGGRPKAATDSRLSTPQPAVTADPPDVDGTDDADDAEVLSIGQPVTAKASRAANRHTDLARSVAVDMAVLFRGGR